MTVAHWDDVPARRFAKGEMDASWQLLGDAAGTQGVGVSRVRVAPGMLPTPPHSHWRAPGSRGRTERPTRCGRATA